MPSLLQWRVIKDFEGNQMLFGICKGHPLWEYGPVLTSQIQEDSFGEGDTVTSLTGRKYTLYEPLPEGEDMEFAVRLLMQKVDRRARRGGVVFTDEERAEIMQDLEKLVAW